MEIISQFFHYLYDAEYAALEADEEYQAAKTARIKAEKELVFAMTRKQRRMFHEYMAKVRQMEKLSGYLSVLLGRKYGFVILGG